MALDNPKSRPLWLRALLYGIAFFVCCEASWYLASREGSDVSFWIPAGFSVSVLLLVETSDWPALLLCAAIANWIFDHLNGTTPGMTTVYAVANTIQTAVGAYLFRRFVSQTTNLKTMRELLGLVACSALCTSSLVATALAGFARALGETAPYFDAWMVGWSSNAVSLVTVAPFVLMWASPSEPRERWWNEPRRLAEMFLLVSGIVVVAVFSFGATAGNAEKFTLLPFILWAALRFGVRGASAVNLLTAVLVIFLASHYPAVYFPADTVSGASVARLYGFLTICAMVGLIPAIAVGERDALVQQLGNSEARFRNLTAAAFEGVFITERGLTLDVNDQGLKLLGYDRAEIVGRSVVEFVSPESRDAVADNIRHGRELVYRHKMIRKDGSQFDAEARARMMEVGNRSIRMTALRDITQSLKDEERRMHLEEQLRQTQKLEALGTLAGGIAHDFNNILTGILGNLQLTEMELSSEHPAQETLEASVQACRRARDLVARILSFSRLEQDYRVAAPIGPTVLEAVQLLRVGLRSDIEIRTNFAPGCPWVAFDSSQIHQVVMNLGTNSVHAMREKGGVLALDLGPVEPSEGLRERHPQVKESHVVRLRLRDNGCGMDEDVLKRVFEPFFTTKADSGGTGLGLAMVHAIVKSHDGAIVVESEPGLGTTFDLYFPASSEMGSRPPGFLASQGDFTPFGDGRKIMLVDDQAEVRVTGSILLRKLGFVPLSFESPVEALKAFKEFPAGICAVISDLTMPEMNGVELAERILALRPDIPILIASGYLPPDTRERFRTLGVASVIGKPFELKEITDQVRALVGKVS